MKETKITLDEKMKKNLATGYDRGVEAKNWDIPTLAGVVQSVAQLTTC